MGDTAHFSSKCIFQPLLLSLKTVTTPHSSKHNAQNSTVALQNLLLYVVIAVKLCIMFDSESVS